MTEGFPKSLLIDDKLYRVAGDQVRTPRYNVGPTAAQPGEFERERIVSLGDGSAGIVGSRRYGNRPSSSGVADVVNGDTSYEDRYGAGPGITPISLSGSDAKHFAEYPMACTTSRVESLTTSSSSTMKMVTVRSGSLTMTVLLRNGESKRRAGTDVRLCPQFPAVCFNN